MHYSGNLEYIVGDSYRRQNPISVNYFSKSLDDNYGFRGENPVIFERQYTETFTNPTKLSQYQNQQKYMTNYATSHSFQPEIFLNQSRPKTRFIDDNDKIKDIVKEAFELMTGKKLPDEISISILPFDEFRLLHSGFGAWSNGILGFSINGKKKQVFVRENHLDALMLVIGHEIGHVLTDVLPNRHDEEAKAFAFSIEWAKTIKNHNIDNLGLGIKDSIDFQPARNGLHDVAFAFVDFMVKKGRKAIELHKDLVKGYVSVFGEIYLI
ncbi:hypothetical protein HYT53_06220 [Candidatus Woesearchaeota archaeon]|nr:hypothetical protein [Candidatus Woesearchaeota archaeon]